MPRRRRRRASSAGKDRSPSQPPPARNLSPRAKAKQAATHLVVVIVLAAGYLAMVSGAVRPGQRVLWDEYGWVAASHSTFKLMFLDPQSGPERWSQGFQATTYGAMNPNFGKLVMGLALYCWGYELDPPPFFPALGPGHPRFDQLSPAQRREMGKAHVPYVVRMRYLVLCTSAACAVVLYFLGRALSGPVLGLAAYVAFASTPLVKLLSFTVYTDNLLVLMMLLSLLASVRFARWWSQPRSVGSRWRAGGALLLIAALCGATVATKFNGALICIACALSVVPPWVTGRFKHHRAWQTVLAFFGVGIVAFAIFVLLNPQLTAGTGTGRYGLENIPGRIAWSIGRWSELLSRQQHGFEARYAITTFAGQVAAVHQRAVLGCGPFAHFLPVGALLLISVGFVVAGWRWIAGFRDRGELVASSFLVIWSLIVVVMTTLWLPMDWPRYCLPLVPVFCLLQALPIDAAVRLLAKRWRARESGSTTGNARDR